ncbi:uncharacterized protein LOC132639941 [Lycium barbarum]|uniref:uncharacterized protein LOC132639941 n=1 Tax=Lycium barbarum TaxID=112863 RepID=UPI00293E31A1|nr:uncharacterized protein LOC132639941 [Lycium barbarum]
MATKYLHFRWKIGGILVSEVGPTFVGGRTEHSFNIDFDHLSIPELVDLAKEFGVINLGTAYIAPKGGALVELTSDRDLLDLGVLLNDGDTIEIYVCNDSSFEDVGPVSQHVIGGAGDNLSKPSGDRESASLFIRYPPLVNTTPTTSLDLENPSSPNCVEGAEANTSGAFASSDFAAENPTGDVDNSEEEDAVNGSDSDLSDDYGSEAGVDEGYEDIDSERTNLRGYLGGDDDEPYYDSSDVDSFASESEGEDISDDEQVEGGTELRARRKTNRVVYNPDCEKVIWQVGQVFQNVKEFREALTKYALKKGVQLDKKKNDTRRVRVKCKEGCPWMIYASKESRSTNFTVKTYNPRHKCHRTNINFLCNFKFLSKHYKERITSQPTIKGWEIQDLVRKDFDIYVGKSVCLRTRKIVLREVIGDHIAEFSRLFDYRDVLLQTNPGSTCVVNVIDKEDGKKEFKNFYICFAAMKLRFMGGCRRCIGLDGCFLKGICKGQLLVAVAKDGNNQMFPIAWVVTGTETKDAWRWFMRILQDDLQLGDGTEVTIISDMQKGLVSAIEEVLPACEHRMLNELDQLGRGIVEDLISYNKERWCKVYFKEFSQCDSVDNNISESFNAWILLARHKTIVSMLEEIRIKVTNRIAKMRAFSETWVDGISPMALKAFNANVERSMNCTLHWNGDCGFEIKEGLGTHIVQLAREYCSCRSWQLKGIPCAHAIAAMHYRRIDPSENIVHWYRQETYLRAYSHFIQPVPDYMARQYKPKDRASGSQKNAWQAKKVQKKGDRRSEKGWKVDKKRDSHEMLWLQV